MYKRSAYWIFPAYIILHYNGCYYNFCNSEGMTSYPHNLALDTQSRFGLALSDFLNLYNFLINWRILMKIVAKCLAFVSLTYQAHAKVCNPIPLNALFYF